MGPSVKTRFFWDHMCIILLRAFVSGLKKKLLKLSNEKECGHLADWIKSILNHLYWVPVSTPDADGALMLEKWKSLTNHLHNHHKHQGPKFSECEHPELVGQERKKKWLKAGDLQYS